MAQPSVMYEQTEPTGWAEIEPTGWTEVAMVTRYEITVTGGTGPVLLAALPGFEPLPDQSLPDQEGCVRLVGPVRDQAALQGLLHRLYVLHLELIAVRRVTN